MGKLQPYKLLSRIILAIGMVVIGAQHFTATEGFVKIVPAFIPYPFFLVYLSGLLEMLAGLGLLIPPLSRQAAWTLVVLYIVVFPANLNQALHNIPVAGLPHDPPLIWLRLPFQAFMVAWAWWFTRNNDDFQQTKIDPI